MTQKLLDSGKLTIEPFPEAITQKLHSIREKTEPLGALFVTDGETGTIYFHPQSELGVLAPLLFHEMIHCLDETLWVAARTLLHIAERNKILLASELRAYSAHYEFLQALMQIYPALSEFLNHAYPHSTLLHHRFARHEIARLYKDA